MSGAMLTTKELIFTFGGSYVCANFGEKRSRNATARMRTDEYTDTLTDTLTNANRFFTALRGMKTGSSDENSVRPSVRPSVCLSVCPTRALWQNGRKIIPYERSFSLVLWEKEWLVGRPLLPEILGQPATVGTKSPILNRYSLVVPRP